MRQKLSVFLVAFCILSFMHAGQAKADSTATVESLQARSRPFKSSSIPSRARSRTRRPSLLLPLPPRRPRPLPRRAVGRHCSITLQ